MLTVEGAILPTVQRYIGIVLTVQGAKLPTAPSYTCIILTVQGAKLWEVGGGPGLGGEGRGANC